MMIVRREGGSMAGRLKWYILILLGIVAIPATVITLLLYRYRPEFHSIDELDPAAVAKLKIRLFNLRAILPPPGEGEPAVPDTIGPFEAQPDDVPSLVALLKGSKPLPEMPPGPFLAEYWFTFSNGREQRIRVKFSGSPAKPEAYRVLFRIGGGQVAGEQDSAPGFEAPCTAAAFVAAVAAAERKATGK
jgi:hypothetical protein